jgi:hypothetical protein
MGYNEDDYVKCFGSDCMKIYHRREIKLDPAGTTTGGVDKYNSVCPYCGKINTMDKKYVGVKDITLHKVRIGTANIADVTVDDDLKEQEIKSTFN